MDATGTSSSRSTRATCWRRSTSLLDAGVEAIAVACLFSFAQPRARAADPGIVEPNARRTRLRRPLVRDQPGAARVPAVRDRSRERVAGAAHGSVPARSRGHAGRVAAGRAAVRDAVQRRVGTVGPRRRRGSPSAGPVRSGGGRSAAHAPEAAACGYSRLRDVRRRRHERRHRRRRSAARPASATEMTLPNGVPVNVPHIEIDDDRRGRREHRRPSMPAGRSTSARTARGPTPVPPLRPRRQRAHATDAHLVLGRLRRRG